MPYKSMKDVNPAIKGIVPQPTLAQANLIAKWADSIKEKRGDVNPWTVAIGLFKKTHHIEGTDDKRKWVRNKDAKVDDLAEQVLDLVAQLEDLQVISIVDYFPWESAPLYIPSYTEGDQEIMGGEPGYVVDLLSDLPQTAEGQPDFSQPFRILPVGTLHRFGKERTVTVDDIKLFDENWRFRTERGIRRKRVVIDLEHEPGGVGEYAEIFSRGEDGLWARISISPKGWEILNKRGDFGFFSPTVAWFSQDRVTGDIVRNQIVGGALTNYPVFGDATALPAMGYSNAALARLWQSGIQLAGYATKARDGVEYPASAWLVVPDSKKPDTWKLRVKEYVNGKLQYTRNMCSKAAQALGPKGFRVKPVQLPAAQKKKAKADLLKIYRNTLKVDKEDIPNHLFSTQKGGHAMTVEFTDRDRNVLDTLANLLGGLITRKGGDPMPADNGNGDTAPITISEEAFATLQGQVTKLTGRVEALSQERDQLKQQVEQGQTQLAAETYARQLQGMRQHAEQYRHLALPLEAQEEEGKPKIVPAQEHFAWLFNADQTEGKDHWAFFNAVLASADAALKEASAFSELGSSQQVEESEDERLHRLALIYSRQHEVDYFTALKAVGAGAVPDQAAQ